MLRPLFLTISLFLLASTTAAQDEKPRNTCYSGGQYGGAPNKPYKKKLWDGYEISLGPVAGEVEFACTAAIYRADGKVVYRTSGFNVIFDEEHTGIDFDGDGKPEVVFKTDTGGGNHCCWAYNIISLSPKPKHLFDVAQDGAVTFDHDENDRVLIRKFTQGPYGGGMTSMAARPFAQKVLRVRDGKLIDVTPEYCAQILSKDNPGFVNWSEVLTEENLQHLRETGPSNSDNEATVSAFFSRLAQYLFCGQYDQALKELALWPESDRARMKLELAAAVKDDYPEFAARLAAAK